jgi:hypothetical protein
MVRASAKGDGNYCRLPWRFATSQVFVLSCTICKGHYRNIMNTTASVSMDIRRYWISKGVAWCMPKEAIKPGGAERTLPLAEILPAIVVYVCRL